MAKTKATSNEQIIAALLQHGTIKEAAAAAGISPRTVYNKFADAEFMAEYAAAKADILRKATVDLNGRLSAAIDTIAEIMADTTANPATRLQAAQTIINSAAKLAERLTEAEKKSVVEDEPFINWPGL